MKKILININLNFIKIALVNGNNLVELIVENQNNPSLVGRVYVGRIKTIMKDKFAFIDIGRNENAFLNLLDKKEKGLYELKNDKPKLKFHQEQELIVQVIKDETGQKGAVVTSQISITGDYLVLFKYPNANVTISVSKKITETSIRSKLLNFFDTILPNGYGVIARTKCSNLNFEEIEKDFENCRQNLENIITKGTHEKSPFLLHEEENIYSKALSELYLDDIDEIIIDNKDEYDKLSKQYNNVHLYNGNMSLFRKYLIEKQIDNILSRKIWLKCGGYIVIDETEAMVAIDVNSGKYTSKKNLEAAALKVNLEAAAEILKQLRIRNLSGIIIVDFIDINFEENKELLLKFLYDNAKNDRLTLNILSMNELGLVTMTRKKTRESVSKILTDNCKFCSSGKILSVYTLADKIFDEITTLSKETIYKTFTIHAREHLINIIKKDISHFEKQEISLNFNIIEADYKITYN